MKWVMVLLVVLFGNGNTSMVFEPPPGASHYEVTIMGAVDKHGNLIGSYTTVTTRDGDVRYIGNCGGRVYVPSGTHFRCFTSLRYSVDGPITVDVIYRDQPASHIVEVRWYRAPSCVIYMPFVSVGDVP